MRESSHLGEQEKELCEEQPGDSESAACPSALTRPRGSEEKGQSMSADPITGRASCCPWGTVCKTQWVTFVHL